MIKNLVDDLKLAAMDMKSEVKDVIHEMTTKLPETVQADYSNADRQTIPASDLEYMGSGWNTMPAQVTANRIDMIADKVNFVSEMIQQGLLAFDSIEVELQTYARGNVPPQPQQLLALASRVDSNQKQIFMGLQKLKELSMEIDRATDKLQGGNTNGWGSKNIGGGW
ncbi:hypothetical protein CHL78_004900 [Romboutsia weinsteinii]|uniref:Uncharacterized protein n=1 Tax=Romboutsia weinsteinii TaxID=2020949 RepID=A0A371J776_9FIRM|nr:hypothetical protein [Romboutsia weinsteinii]RDY28528.1 hypothetical protein CHL78_004900 [Romboutsia weinsteinii]